MRLAATTEFVSLDELGQRLSEGRRDDRPLAAVTFDDGYRDVYENAFPMLVRKGIPAAVFVVTKLIGTSRTSDARPAGSACAAGAGPLAVAGRDVPAPARCSGYAGSAHCSRRRSPRMRLRGRARC